MANGYYRAQVTIPMDSGLPADSAVNVWSFHNLGGAAVPATDALDIVTTLDGFYTAIASLFSSQCVLASTTVKVFDMADTQPRVPLLETTQGFGAEVTSNMDFPPEVAMCLSFKAAPQSGANARRRRGRIYLGPLQSSTTTDYNIVLAANITTIMAAADANLAPATGNVRWAIYSPYTHHAVPIGENINATEEDGETPLYPEVPAALPDSYTAVSTYWMDNAWDTQRRRGTKATSRTAATV